MGMVCNFYMWDRKCIQNFYWKILLERALRILQRCVTVKIKECTRIPDEMKKTDDNTISRSSK